MTEADPAVTRTTAQSTAQSELPVYDLVGVGFGPSNLALAIAATEHNAEHRADGEQLSVRFLEQQPAFGWHRGMLLDDATMQVSFLKDLVTLRNPASRFSFLSFLHDRGRLIDFINHKSLFPLRLEFHDYLEWAAAKVDDLVSWSSEVIEIAPVLEDGVVTCLDVTARHGAEVTTYRTRNVVLGTGLVPRLPDGVSLSDRVWHSEQLLVRVKDFEDSGSVSPSRFVVVGAGQSAAEVTSFLHQRYPTAEICSVFSRYGYSPADDSPFANRIFDPTAVDDFYDASPEVKAMLVGYHGNTNYSVVDGDLIEDLYRRSYQEKVTGTERLKMLNVSRVAELIDDGESIRVTIEALSTGKTYDLDADVIVYSTGYRHADPYRLLGEVGVHCPPDATGRPQVQRDYRVVTTPELACGIYLQGGTEHTHGLSSSLLSNVAVRAGEILDSIVRGGATDLELSLVAEPDYAQTY
jgi:L-ornithine N5-oxygenase